MAVFEAAIDKCPTLRRTGSAVLRSGEVADELRCEVEYGPVLGCYVSDLRNRLKFDIVPALGRTSNFELLDFGVLSFVRHECEPQEIEEEIVELTRRLDDTSLPVPVREIVSQLIEQRRRYLAENNDVEF
jgi:hypothetical protein